MRRLGPSQAMGHIMTEPTAAAESTYESGHILAQIVTVLLIIFIVTSLPYAGLTLAAIPLLERAASPESDFDQVLALLDGAIAVTYLGANIKHLSAFIGLAAIVAFLTWIIRVHTNLTALGARNLRFETIWAVAWWLIPFAQLFLPYKVVLEIWHGSDQKGSGEVDEKSSPPLVGWWWALTAAAAAIGLYWFPIGDTLDLRAGSVNIVADLYLGAAVSILTIGSAVMCILVVRQIDQMQSAKRAARFEM